MAARPLSLPKMLSSSHQATFAEYFRRRNLVILYSSVFSCNVSDSKGHRSYFCGIPTCGPGSYLCVHIPSNTLFPDLSFINRAIERTTYVFLSMVMASPKFVWPTSKSGANIQWVSFSLPPLPSCWWRNITSKVLWGSKITKSPPTVAYGKVMSDDRGLFEWLSNVVSR